jgi:hypothetical protein
MGVISEADKKILLERLAKAREAKVAKKKALNAAALSVAAPVPDVAPVAPAPAPISVAAPATPQPSVDEVPPLPDLVAAAAKKPKPKKVKVPDSDDSSDEEMHSAAALPPKKGKNAAPYMKIKIYRDSPKALESILQTIQDAEHDDDEPAKPAMSEPPSAAIPVQRCNTRAVCMTGSRPSTNTQVLRTSNPLRDAALAFFS